MKIDSANRLASREARPREARRERLAAVRREALPVLLMLPAVLLVVLVTFLPIAQAIILSFHETSYLVQGKFIGLQHYTRQLAKPDIRASLATSLLFTACALTLSLSLAMGMALLLNRAFRGRAVFRTIFVMPWVVSQIITSLLWQWLYSPTIGALAYVLSVIAGRRVDILGDPNTALTGVVLAGVWHTWPWAMVLILAALQTIPHELYEAAKIDGCGHLNLLRYVTFPMIQNTFLIVTIVLSLRYFNMTELPFVLTGGGPVSRTELIGLRVYREAFIRFGFGSASALAVVMFLINILASLLYIRALRAESRY